MTAINYLLLLDRLAAQWVHLSFQLRHLKSKPRPPSSTGVEISGQDDDSSAIVKIESEQHSSWPAQMCDDYDSLIWLRRQNGTVLLQVLLFTKQ